MGDENLAAGAVERWQARAQNLISFAAVAAPLREDDYGRFLEAGFSEPEAQLEGDVSDFLQSSEDAIPDGSGTSGLPILLGNLEVANTLLVASQEPEIALAERGLDGSLFNESYRRLSELAAAAGGAVILSPRPLAPAVTAKFDALQDAGATELIELVKSPTVHSAVIGGVNGIIVIAGPVAKEAFEAVRDALSWIKAQAVRIIEWVVAKLRSLVPEPFREKFDELVDTVKQKLDTGVIDLVGEALGALLGRPSATAAWASLPEGRSAQLEPQLDEATKGQLARIEYVKVARETVDKFRIITSGIAAVADGPVRIVALVVVGSVFAFVGYQVFDGFQRLERLAQH